MTLSACSIELEESLLAEVQTPDTMWKSITSMTIEPPMPNRIGHT
jgi:hypothetical protein